jgi:large subunit ribosomal protein L31
MKAKIHPKYYDCHVHCGCGNNFETRATVKELRVEICSACHPFYSGKQKFVDSAGRIDSFMRRYGSSSGAKPVAGAPAAAAAPAAAPQA